MADAEGFERFHLAGHSMGGLIAQAVALRAPGRVLSLALLCTFLHGREAARLTPDIIWAGLRTRLGTRAMRRRAFMQLVMPDAYLRSAAADARRRSGRPVRPRSRGPAADRDEAAAGRLALRRERPPRRARGIPTLVVAATHDRIALPAFGRALAEAIPGARYVEIPDAGHGCTIQCADRVNALLVDHFERAVRPIAALFTVTLPSLSTAPAARWRPSAPGRDDEHDDTRRNPVEPLDGRSAVGVASAPRGAGSEIGTSSSSLLNDTCSSIAPIARLRSTLSPAGSGVRAAIR